MNNHSGTTSYHTTALTAEAINQHQQHHPHTTHGGIQSIQRFATVSSFLYQRFNGYQSLYNGGTATSKAHTEHHQHPYTPLGDTTSYASTPSIDATPSYNSTASVAYNYTPSSIQAELEIELELEPYTYAHTSYWRPEESGQLSDATRYGVAYTGVQFVEVEVEVTSAETRKE